MSTKVDSEGWVTKTRKWSSKVGKGKKSLNIQDNVPTEVVDMVVEEFLSHVADTDWNNPENVSKVIARMMSIDLNKPIDKQVPKQETNIIRAILIPSNKESSIPYWILQSIVIVDMKTRYIEYQGSTYNKINIARFNPYFRKRISEVAEAARCHWNIRWGNSKNPKHRLYLKVNKDKGEEFSWLALSMEDLWNDEDEDPIDIRNLIMLEFHRKFPQDSPREEGSISGEDQGSGNYDGGDYDTDGENGD